MKKKIYAMIKSVLLVLFVSCCLFACSAAEEPTQATFENFNVQATATAELKSYYVFEKPEVNVGEEKASINVSVAYDGKTVPNNGVKVYLEYTGKYSICYTAAYKDSFESKTTELTVTDTTAPVFAFNFPKYTDYGASVALDDYCKAVDATAVESVVYSVKDVETEAELDANQFDKTNGILTVTDTAVKKVAITATATDANGYTSSQTVETNMLVPDEVGTVGVEYIEYYGSAAGEIALVDDQTQGKAVEWTTQVPSGGFYTYWVKHEKYVEFADYDYIDIVLKVEIEKDSTKNVLVYLGASEYTQLASGTYCGVSSLAEWSTITYSKTVTVNHSSAAFESFAQGQIGFSLKNNDYDNSFKGKVYIAEIRGRYADMSCDGAAIDLTKKYEGIQSASFTPLGMSQAQTIDDLSAWTPATGALSFVVSKENQSSRTFEVKTVSMEKNKVGSVSATNIYLNGTTVGEKTLALDDTNGTVVAWKVSVPQSAMYTYWIDCNDFVDYDGYDYIDYKIKVVPDESNESANVLVYPNNVQYAECTGGNVFGVANATEWTTVSFAKTGNKGVDTFAAFETGKIGLSLKNNNLENTLSFTVYIAEISCRYASVEASNATIDLTEKYAGIKSASFTPFGETQAQAIDVLSAWIAADGTLSFTVAKDGCLDNVYTIDVTLADSIGTISAKTIATKGVYSINGLSGSNESLTLESDDTYGTVAVWKTKLAGNSWAHLTVTNEQYADFANYDYVDFLIKIVPAETNVTTNVIVYPNKTDYAQDAENRYFGISYAAEWTTVTFAKTSNKGTDVFNSFSINNAVTLSLKNNKNYADCTTPQEFTVYIAKISVR